MTPDIAHVRGAQEDDNGPFAEPAVFDGTLIADHENTL
jgi:hypothetical protein